MRKATVLTLTSIVGGYLLFSVGFYITAYLTVGGVEFESLEELNRGIGKTLSYVDLIVSPLVAIIVGMIVGGFGGRGAWKIALLSTLPIFAYYHLVKFPEVDMPLAGELIRGGRYMTIGIITALIFIRLKQRLKPERKAEVVDLPEYGARTEVG